jgi:hypothetical protein
MSIMIYTVGVRKFQVVERHAIRTIEEGASMPCSPMKLHKLVWWHAAANRRLRVPSQVHHISRTYQQYAQPHGMAQVPDTLVAYMTIENCYNDRNGALSKTHMAPWN